jgi:hypothetical protein
VNVVTHPLEEPVRSRIHNNVKVAGLATEAAGLTFAWNTDTRSAVDAGGQFDAKRFASRDAAFAAALTAIFDETA